MATSSLSQENSHIGKRRLWRGLALVVASVLLHLIAFNWAAGRIGTLSWRNQSPTIVTAELQMAAPPPPVAAPKPAPPKPRPKRKRASKPPQPLPPPVAQAAPPVEITPLPAPAVTEVADTGVEPVTEAGAGAEPAAQESVAPAATETPVVEERLAAYKVNPPPSAELKYDVQSMREGQATYGYGKITWQAEGSNYAVTGEAGVLFFSLLHFRSEGVIDDFGVAPVIYSEKRFRRAETNTRFDRDLNTINFSASARSYPRTGGEQDRASIVWQLAGIGRGDSEKFVPDAEIDIFVAGVRDAETWQVRVIGLEEIEVGLGKIAAWHMVRLPRRGTHDQQLDIWLAPEQKWFPVKLRYTETNGDYLDMSLSNVHFPAAR